MNINNPVIKEICRILENRSGHNFGVNAAIEHKAKPEYNRSTRSWKLTGNYCVGTKIFINYEIVAEKGVVSIKTWSDYSNIDATIMYADPQMFDKVWQVIEKRSVVQIRTKLKQYEASYAFASQNFVSD